MNNYIFDNKTFVAKSLPHIAIRKYIYKKYDVTSLEEFFNGNKCYYSSNYARVELKSTEDFCVYIGYKNAPYRCGEKLCGCTKLNPQQFTYLITCAGMTEADAKTHLQKKARAGVSTSTDLGYFDDPQNNPFQKGFWIKKGYSEQQAQQKLDDRNDKTVATKAKNGYFDDPQNNPFQKGFWIKKGYSEQQAQQKVNSRNFWCKEFSGPEYHNPATVEFYIQKYGYDIGIERRNEIIKRATFQNSLAGHVARFGETDGRAKFLEKTLKNGGHNCSVSRAQKIFFKTLYKVLRRMNLIAAKQMHAGLVGSKEYSIRDDSEGYRYDCYIPEYALIIEFNGALWHPRRDMMSEEKYKQWKMPYANNAGVTAAEKEAKDMKKLDLAKRLGYNILEVWDFDDVSVNIMKCLDKIQRIENGN